MRQRRDRLADDLLSELTAWNPREWITAIKRWHRGPLGALTLVHLNVIAELEMHGQMSMGQLAEALDVSVASATGIVSRMEHRGLVERRHAGSDRRVVMVGPTATGSKIFGEMEARRRARLGKLLEHLTDDELAGFATGLGHSARRVPTMPRRSRQMRPAAPRERERERERTMIALLRTYLRPYTWPVVLVVVLLFVQSIANLLLPNLNADIINNGIAKDDTTYIIQVGAVMLGVTLILGIVSIIVVYWSARVAMGFGRDVRTAIFRAVEGFSQVEINHFGPASLITRNTNDVQQVQMVVFMAMTLMISAPIMIVGGVIMAIREDGPLSALLIVILPLMILVIGMVMVRAIPLFRALQLKLDRMNQVMRETLAGVRVIRAFVRIEHEERRFDSVNQDLYETGLKVNRLFALTIPTLTAIVNLSTVAVMWFGAIRVDSGAMPIGNLTAFIQYLALILFSVLGAVIMFIFVPRAAVSSVRIQEVLQTEISIRDPERPIRLVDAGQRGVIEFRDVEFRYPGAEQPVLRGVSFKALPGQTTAIVGSTGSGKSTLINLIPRFYDATEGQVLLDGIDVRSVDRDDLWHRIGFVPQKAFLFSGTVASNLRYGDEAATDDELWQTLEIAQARDFVEEMDGQLEASITQGGTNVSGGQRQRLAIARALARKGGIYVFDDSFSALDFGTDARLRAALAKSLGWATVIIVAQRVGTIMKADRIIVMDAGRVVGVGTHTELMAGNETYREIVYSQLSAAEAVA